MFEQLFELFRFISKDSAKLDKGDMEGLVFGGLIKDQSYS